jgi:agarase
MKRAAAALAVGNLVGDRRSIMGPELIPAGGEIQLPIEEGRWRRRFTSVEGVPDDEAVRLAFGRDPDRGPTLDIGPWLAGAWVAGFEYGDALPFVRGTIRGVYRTKDVRPSGVRIGVTFYHDDTRIGAKRLWLGPAPDWRAFELAVRVPAPTADRMVPSFGLAQKTEGEVRFAQLEATPEVAPFPTTGALDAPRRARPPDDLGPGAFIRLAERDGTWWLVTPEGGGFYSAGTDGPWFSRDEDHLRTGLDHADFLYGCGFNSLAGWTDIVRWGELNDLLVSRGRPPFIMFSALQTTGRNHDFPDPFDPRFEQWYRARARRSAEVVRGRPWFGGWFADNEVGHHELYRHVYSTHCSAAFGRFLGDRHGSIAALNAAWGADFRSFEDLLARKPDPVRAQGPMYDDCRAFEREIVRRYVDITLRALRDADPDHLIISNRFMLGDVGGWLDLLDLYRPYDAIAVNLYPANQRPGLSDDERDIYRLAHEKTGLPVIVGEWSVPAADSGLYGKPDKLDWSFNELLPTQAQRAHQAACVTLDFFNMPFVVGSHWFIWKDVVNERREANRGLFTHDGRPWREVADALRHVHQVMGVGLG